MNNLLIIGSVNLDLVTKVEKMPKIGETIKCLSYYESCGGKGANQTFASQKLGLNVDFLTMIGEDEAGKKLKENLIKNKVKLHALTTLTPTGLAFITVDENADNSIIVYPGANNMLKKEHLDLNIELIQKNDMLIMQNEILLETTLYALQLAKSIIKLQFLIQLLLKNLMILYMNM